MYYLNFFTQKILLFLRETGSSIHTFVSADPYVIKLKNYVDSKNEFLGKNFYHISYLLSSLIVLYFVFYLSFWRAPSNFQIFSLAPIEKGAHLKDIANNYEREGIVRSSFWLKFFIIMSGGEKRIIAGDYYFPKPVSIFGVVNRVLQGDFGLTQRRVVLHEGLNSGEMAEVLASSLPRFNKGEFENEAKEFEGYLFPDTYFFTPNQTVSDIILMMRENFARKTESLSLDLEKFGKPLNEVVTVASIVEDEASSIEDKRIVAGIIWKRLKLDMPLQVDSTLRYVNGKESHELTKDELEDKDNPYNTYANKGLPLGPISNPGLDSLRAAIAPTNTKYVYFLSDKNGTIHYAATFEQHKNNRELYLQ